MTCGLATALEPPHFNHAPVRGAIGAIQYVAGYVTKFQSTHPRGVRRDGQPPDCRCGDVSIHAPAWGATRIYLHLRITLTGFQSTHPRGVRPFQYLDQCREGKSFNPRTRVGCDHASCSSNPQLLVSIHAPAWGATWRRDPVRRGSPVFQSTHPRGVRHLGGGKQTIQFSVSIHAPAWGATALKDAGWQISIRFNPRTRVGCDITGTDGELRETKFQSTHPRGVRLRAACMAMSHFMVSIHAPAWGATRASEARMPSVFKFQSTHPRGVRHTDMYLYGLECRFQSTHPRGVRPVGTLRGHGIGAMFQSTHPRGVRPSKRVCPKRHTLVSIHAPAWGATTVGFR